jgi:DNA-binding PadR family transcriptional regulator
MCGVDIMQGVKFVSKGRIKVGPGTLYALLGRFEKDGIIVETKVVLRKKSYIITDKGKEILKEEFERLQRLIVDGNDILGGL